MRRIKTINKKQKIKIKKTLTAREIEIFDLSAIYVSNRK